MQWRSSGVDKVIEFNYLSQIKGLKESQKVLLTALQEIQSRAEIESKGNQNSAWVWIAEIARQARNTEGEI